MSLKINSLYMDTKYFSNIPSSESIVIKQVEKILGKYLLSSIDFKTLKLPPRYYHLPLKSRRLEIFSIVLRKVSISSKILAGLKNPFYKSFVQRLGTQDVKEDLNRVIEALDKKDVSDKGMESEKPENLEQFLLRRGARGDAPIHIIFKEDQYQPYRIGLVKRFPQHLLYPNALGISPLYSICKKGEVNLLKAIPKKLRKELAAGTPSPFEGALYSKQEKVIDYILSQCEVTPKEKYGKAFFSLGAADLMTSLAEKHPQFFWKCIDEKDVPYLFSLCCKEDRLGLFKRVESLSKTIKNIPLTKVGHMPPPIVTVIQHSSKKIFKYILGEERIWDHSILSRKIDGVGKSSLSFIIRLDRVELIKIILEKNKLKVLLDELEEHGISMGYICTHATDCSKLFTEQDPKWVDGQGNNFAHIACAVGNYELVEWLWEKRQQLFYHKNSDGYSPFVFGAAHGKIKIIDLLLQKDKKLSKQQGLNGNFLCEIIAFLKDKKITPEFGQWLVNLSNLTHYICLNAQKRHVTHIAAGIGQKKLALFFMKKMKRELLLQQDDSGNTFLHYLLTECDDLTVDDLKLVLEHTGPKILRLQNNDKSTPLHIAANREHFTKNEKLVFYFLAGKYTEGLGVYDCWGNTPLQLFAFSTETPIEMMSWDQRYFKYLSQTTEKTKKTLLHLSVHKNIVPGWIKFLTEEIKIDINVRDTAKSTPLHEVCKEGLTIDNLKMLVKCGASTQCIDDKGRRPFECLTQSDDSLGLLEDFFIWIGKDTKFLTTDALKEMQKLFVSSLKYTVQLEGKELKVLLGAIFSNSKEKIKPCKFSTFFKGSQPSAEIEKGSKKILKMIKEADMNNIVSGKNAEKLGEDFLLGCVLHQIVQSLQSFKKRGEWHKDMSQIALALGNDNTYLGVKRTLALSLKMQGKNKSLEQATRKMHIVWEILKLRIGILNAIFKQQTKKFEIDEKLKKKIWESSLITNFGEKEKFSKTTLEYCGQGEKKRWIPSVVRQINHKNVSQPKKVSVDITKEGMQEWYTPFQVLGYVRYLLENNSDWKKNLWKKESLQELIDLATSLGLIKEKK